ncbi:hypothetical protein ACI76O_11500 [Capnocytophaga cynodegmi]|uniref:hypothetical protein n=1 Tax=Capnocytophaga cynodegmi TaxID=28189 RepID=UPI00385BDAE5
MKVKKKNVLMLLFILTQVMYSQEYNNRVYSYGIEEMSYFKYENVKIFATLEDISQAENKTPEQLAQSILSCSSREWDVKNTLGGVNNVSEKTKEEYSQIKSMDKKKNYFELISKIEFEIDKIPTAVLKMYFFSESFPNPQAGIFVMQKYNDVWYKTSTKQINNIALTILRLKPEILDAIMNNNYNIDYLQKIKGNVTTDNILDFNKLSIELEKLSESDSSVFYKLKDEYSIL